MWTIYCGEEVVDLLDDREVGELLHFVQHTDADMDIVLDLLREVVVLL